MQNRIGTTVVIALGWFVGTVSGCGNPSQVHQVTGVVFLNRIPVEGAEVVFLPVAAVDAKSARGKTDAHGHFYLNTYFGPSNDVIGAAAGDYAVTIRKVREISGPDNLPKPEDLAIPKNELPSRYADPTISGLSATVTAKAVNDFEFQLVGSPP